MKSKDVTRTTVISPSAPHQPIQSMTHPQLTTNLHNWPKNHTSSPLWTTTISNSENDCALSTKPKPITTDLSEITTIDSHQSCIPPINQLHNTAYTTNLPQALGCPPDNQNFPPNANLPLSNLWAYCPIMASPEITHTTASNHATPHPPTISTLFPMQMNSNNN